MQVPAIAKTPKKTEKATKTAKQTAKTTTARKTKSKSASKPRRASSALQLAKDILGSSHDVTETLEADLRESRIVRRLFALRSARKVSQEQIAKHLNCSQSRVSKIENGTDADLKFGELKAYAKAMQLDVRVGLQPENINAVDRIKLHAFAIKRELDNLSDLAQKDESLAKGISAFWGEAFLNVVGMMAENAKTLPESEYRPRIQIEVNELEGSESE